jgi:hypothetical protein
MYLHPYMCELVEVLIFVFKIIDIPIGARESSHRLTFDCAVIFT